ncbi:MAG: DUF2252 family protein [Magnetococcales bacterium]|nr:DUF2252 family protein [Magnetococcales bacterium]
MNKIEESTKKDDNDVETPSAFKFFRAFVPYFYDLLRREKPNLGGLGAIDTARGWVVGDAHVENFGVIYSPDTPGVEKYQFTMNDSDDGGPGFFYADILRFVTSVILNDEWSLTVSNDDLEQVIERYVRGLNGQKSNGGTRDDWIDEAKGKDPGVKDDYYTFNSTDGYKLAPRNASEGNWVYDYCLSQRDKSAIEEKINGFYENEWTICDVIKMSKRAGGSGGLIQYRVLMIQAGLNCQEPVGDADQDIMVVDLKPLVRPGIYPLMCDCPVYINADSHACALDPEKIKQRVEKTLKEERGYTESEYNRVVNIDNIGPLDIRPRRRRDGVGVEADEADMNDIRLEANTLGIIHRKTLMDLPDAGLGYICGVTSDCGSAAIISAARQMAALIKDDFAIVSSIAS